MSSQKEFLTEREVSELTGRALSTLRNDRWLRKGFPYTRIGRSIRYSLRDIRDFMEERRIVPRAHDR